MTTWFPESFVYRASDCFSALEKSTIDPTFEPPAVKGEPTTSDGSTRTCEIDTISDGVPAGCTSIVDPYKRPFSTTLLIESTLPSTGEYTSVPAAAPTCSDEVDGPCPPGSWYQPGPADEPPNTAWTTRRRI